MNLPAHDRAYIGGGNIAGILGVSPFKTPLDEYHVIIGDAPGIDAETERFFKRRKALEPYAAAMLEERGLKVVRQNERYTDSTYPFLRAEIDAETEGDVNAEFKSVHPLAAKSWGLDEIGEAPTYVTAQAYHGLMVTQRQLCHVVAVIGFDDSRVYPVTTDNEVALAIRAKAVEFWEEHILPRRPPEPTTAGDVERWLTPDPAAIVVADDSADLLADVREFLSLRAFAKQQAEDVDALKDRIKLAMGAATTLYVGGKKVITWKPQTANRIDTKALRAEAPEVAEAFTKPSESRVFRVSEK